MSSFKGLSCFLALIFVVTIAGCSTSKNQAVYMDAPGVPVSPVSVSSSEAPPKAVQEPVIANASAQEPASSEKASEETAVAESAAAPPTEPESTPEPIVTPDDTLSGRIVSVNEAGRFVVLRFPLGQMPAKDTRLDVYRQGLKVAEVKISGPQKDDHTVADIMTGECRGGDEVRDR